MKVILVLLLSVLCASVSPSVINEGKRLIKTSAEGEAKWMTESQIWDLIQQHTNFIDITDHTSPQITGTDVTNKAIPIAIRFPTRVNAVLPRLNMARVQDFVTTFSSYHTRYYTSTTGTQSQQWLLAQVQSSVVGYSGEIEVNEVVHSWAQRSIVARIRGADPTLRNEVVIIGAHQDSVNTAGASLNAPGADDNASGSVVVLETLRVLVEAGFIPKRTLEFHWYAAEEVGLRGSAEIARNYATTGVDVVAMINYDVPGYHVQGTDNVGIYTDNTSADLNRFLRLLVDEFLNYGWVNRVCGYGCSDHASWTGNGFPAAMPAEVVLHPRMHSANDNLASVGFTQVMEFCKLAVSIMVEIGEPQTL